MEDQLSPAAAILFFAGMPFLLILQWKLGFWKKKYTRHQDRNLYALIVGTFFVSVFVVMFRPDIPELALSAALAFAIAIPSSLLVHWYYRKKIRGGKMMVSGRSKKWQALMVGGIVVAVMVFARTPVGEMFMDAHWLVLALAMAWPIATAYAYFHVSRLERAQGYPIEEAPQ